MTVDQIGELRREFKPGIETIIAGVVMGLLLVGAGCTLILMCAGGVAETGGNMPFHKEGPGWAWDGVGLGSAIGLGLIAGGILLIWWVLSLRSFRVHVGEKGVAVFRKKAVQVFGWDDIASVQETHLYQGLPIVKGVARHAMPKTMSKSFIVKMKQGDPFTFNGDTIRVHSRLAKMIREETEPRSIPWEIVERYG